MRQRVYALAGGYEDLNDYQQLRHDLAFQSAVERAEGLASSSTLCRWENQANRQTAWHIHQVMIERFVASFKQAPKELILDFDATDDAVHGKQEGRFFHAFTPLLLSTAVCVLPGSTAGKLPAARQY